MFHSLKIFDKICGHKKSHVETQGNGWIEVCDGCGKWLGYHLHQTGVMGSGKRVGFIEVLGKQQYNCKICKDGESLPHVTTEAEYRSLGREVVST